MARIVRFDLTMKDGYKVEREIQELRDHFDLETVLGYYHDGTLSRWLKRNKYAEEAAEVEQLTEGDDLARELCRILVVDLPDTAVDSDEIRDRQVRLARLKDYTDEPTLLAMAENAAFTQADLDILTAVGADEIILCNGRFTIPLNVRGTTYYGVGRAVAVIESDVPVDFARRHIAFDDVDFDEAYQAVEERGQADVQQTAEETRRAAEAQRREEERIQAAQRREENKRREEERRQAEAQRRAEEKRKAEAAAKAEKQAHEMRVKQKYEKAAEILAETLGVLMHGNLFGGRRLWGRSHRVGVSGFSFRPWGRSEMKKLLEKQGGKVLDGQFGSGERIIGGTVLVAPKKKEEGFTKGQWGSLAMMAAPLIPGIGWTAAAIGAVAFGVQALFKDESTPVSMIFTDAALYINDKGIPYTMMENVTKVYGEDGQTALRLKISREKDAVDLPLGKYLDTEAVQLFLIAAINFYEKHYKRSPNTSEVQQLKYVTLATMNDDCILDYLG